MCCDITAITNLSNVHWRISGHLNDYIPGGNSGRQLTNGSPLDQSAKNFGIRATCQVYANHRNFCYGADYCTGDNPALLHSHS